MRNLRGFTLIELAIVLVIIGLLVGLGAGMIGLLVKRAKYSESKEIVKENVEAVIGYALTHKHLPGNASEIQRAMKSFRDSYGKRLMYVFSNNLALNKICSQTQTNISICFNPPCSSLSNLNLIRDVAFLVISADGNYNHQTINSSLLGRAIRKISDSPLIVLTATGNIVVDIYPPGTQNVDGWWNDVDRSEEYDDIIEYETLSHLQGLLNCSNNSNIDNYILFVSDFFFKLNNANCISSKRTPLAGLSGSLKLQMFRDKKCRKSLSVNGYSSPVALSVLDKNSDRMVYIACSPRQCIAN